MFKTEVLNKSGKKDPGKTEAIPFVLKSKSYLKRIFRDITERKNAERIIEDIREYNENIVNTIREPLIVLNGDLRVKSANKSFYNVFKVTPDVTIGRRIYNLGNKQWNIPKLRDLLETILPNNASFDNYRVEHVFPHIGKRIMILNARRIPRPPAKPRIILLAIEDITDKKLILDTLKDSEEKFKQFFENSNDAIYIADYLTRRLVSCNKKAEILVERSRIEVLSMHAEDLYPKDKVAETIKGFHNQIKGRVKFIESEVVTKTGKRIPVEISTSIVNITGKKYLLGIYREIIERKQVEEKLKLFSNAIASAFDYFLITDIKGAITYVNESAIRAFGYTPGELLGLNINRLDADPKAGKKVIRELMIKGKWSGEVLNIKKNKKTFPSILSAFTIRDEKGNPKGTMGILKDITERKRSETALKDQAYVLAERVKELNCLYNFSKLISEQGNSGEKLYRNTVNLIASAMQFPNSACVQITLQGKKYRNKNFRTTALRQVSNIIVNTKRLGTVEVHYRQEEINTRNRFFLKEEKDLISIVAERLGRNIERNQSEERTRENEKKFRAVFEGAGDGILAIDPKTKKFVFANPKICKLIGYSESELVKLKIEDIHPKRDLPYVLDQFQKQAQGKIVIAKDIPVLKKDRKIIFCDIGSETIKIGKRILLLGFFRDITKSKKAAEELRESEIKFEAIFDNANDGILLADMKTKKFTTGNNTICQMLGYSLEEIKKLGVTDIHPKEDVPFVLEQFGMQVKGDIKIAKDIPMKRKDGSVFYADVNSSSVKLTGKTYLLGLFRDISDRKSSEEQLKYKTVILEAESNASIDGILIVDENGKTLLTNKRFQEMWGIPQEILDSKDDEKMLQHVAFKLSKPDEFVAKVKYLYDHKDEKSMEEIEFKDGKIFDRYSTPLSDVNHKYLGRIWYFHDKTAIKQAETKLREEKAKLEKYFDVIGIIALVLNVKGDILLMNKRGCEILGYTPDEVVGKNWVTDFLLKDKKSKPGNFLEELTKEGSDNTYFEHSVITKDGKEKNITWGSIPILDEAGDIQAFMCAGEDVTTLREAEVTITQLQEFDRLKDEFLNIAAHELRTPLTSIIGLSEIIKTQKASLPPQMAEYPEIIFNEGLRLSHVIKRILTITRYESGKEEVHPEPINLAALIPSLLPGLNVLSKDKNITIATNLKEENLQIESDKEMISEVIINLVDNSIKYGLENNTITISAYRDGGIDEGLVRINIADQGPGIPPDSIDKLFNKFSQLEPSLSRSQEGTGLGLYICKLIVEKLGGRIGVDSEVGKGSTFYFTLPAENTAIQ